MPKAQRGKQYTDEVYGSCFLSPIQNDLHRTNAVRKTGYIKALGLSDHVYFGATHSRRNHIVGTSLLVSQFCDALKLGNHDRAVLEAAAMLHDIGHLAFCHAAQKYFAHKGLIHEATAGKIITDRTPEIYSILRDHSIDPEHVAGLIHDDDFSATNPFLMYQKQLISGTLDCDRLNYLVVDSLHTAEYGKGIDVPRLLTCVFLDGGRVVYPREADSAIESFFSAYINMYRSVYFNPKVKALESMLTQAMFMKDDILSKEVDLLQVSEETLSELLMSEECNTTREHEIATRIAKRLFKGDSFSDAYNLSTSDYNLKEFDRIKRQFPEDRPFSESLLEFLISKTGLKEGELLVLDNSTNKKPEYDDLLIEEEGIIRPAHEVLNLASFHPMYKNRFLLRVLADKEDKGRIMDAMDSL